MLFAARAKAKQAKAEHLRDLEAQIAAMDRSQAVIEFKLDGTILRANDNFLSALGYTAAEVVGRHHSLFLPAGEAESDTYRAFWRELNQGAFIARKFLRVGKNGKPCWIQASYNPVLDTSGKPYKVIKFATDVTEVELERTRSEQEREASATEQSLVVDTLADSLRRVAEGDLTTRVTAALSGRYQQIKDDFNTAVESLRQTVTAISASTSGLNTASVEIATASDDLSRRTEQQAASLEQTAAALDQITATVKRSASGATQASSAASNARSDAARSGEVMTDAVAAMGEIERSSREISQILGVIDEIAFQTNLLALNAGVEAARAGDAGRGFAVVAQEVRLLAQRSAEAAKEIKALILDSTGHVERGVRLVGDTGQALGGIVARITEIDTLVSEIAQSAQEQALGLNQVNTAVNQMDHVTQQNAAMVEQVTAAAGALKSEAGELGRLVARFRTGEEPTRPRPELVPAPRMRAAANARPAYDTWEEF
jgi:methyl-accepting chemotaxis protein